MAKFLPHGLCLAGLLCLCAGAGRAETAQFDLTVAGIRAGILAFNGEELNGRYAASGAVRSTGLVGLLLDVSADVSATGRVKGNSYSPDTYKESSVQDGKTVTRSFTYSGGLPQITRDPPLDRPQKHAADPASQAGTVDAMTLAYALLRDRPAELACTLSLDLYDGRRRAGITLGPAQPTANGGMNCSGQYRREEGFSGSEMKQPVWPFTVTYAPAGSQLEVTEIDIPTSFGMLRMRRQ